MLLSTSQGANALCIHPTTMLARKGLMQMSDMLAWAQVLVGVATFIVAVLALIKENPPNNGGNSNHNDED